jgi:hypothetical protein
MRRALALIALLAGGRGAVAADESPRVLVTASRTEVGVGETFTVEAKAYGPAGTVWSFPAEAGNEQVELRTPVPPKGAAPEPLPPGVFRYDAAVFALGEVEVPAIAVRYRLPDGTPGEAATTPIKLRIVSILPKDPSQQQLADIRGPMALAIGLPFWIAVGIVSLLLAGLVYWAVRRRRRASLPAEAAVPEQPPDAEARQALDALAAGDLVARGAFREYYIALIDIAKRYLERRLQAPVMEMTSAETVAFLREHRQIHDLDFAVRDLTGAADQVKFAGSLAAAEEARRHLAMVRQLVDTVEQRLSPPKAEERAA